MPGKSSPYHWQMGEEECCVVIAGTPTLRTPEGERVLKPWDIAWFGRGPAGTHEVHTLSVGKALTGENAFR